MSTRLTPQGTLYDVLEKRDWFKFNPANVSSVTSEGIPNYTKQEFPVMLYHPDGETEIIVPAEIIITPLGPKAVGEQREIIWMLANSQAELDTALAAGWHRRPSLSAIHNRDLPVPQKTQDDEMELMRERIRELEAKAAADEED